MIESSPVDIQAAPSPSTRRARRAFLASPLTYIGLAIVVGVTCRGVDYGKNRQLWMDEEDLRANIVGRPIFEMHRPLVRDQLAPPGFLVAARLSSRVLGGSSRAIRFLPFVFGISGLFALPALGRRTVSPWAVPLALGMAALSDDLIYYSGEFKQYSLDFLVAIGSAVMTLDLGDGPLTRRRVAWASAVGAVLVWCSHPSIFVLAGGGLWLAVHRRRELRPVVLIGSAWLVSFAGCYWVSRKLLGDGDFMWRWWNFAFLPIPPRSGDDARHVFWALANVFTNPAGIVTPLGWVESGLLALGLFLVGAISLAARRRWDALAVLLAPVGLTLLASALQRYPFHGRVVMFLVPALLLLTAEGAATVGRLRGVGPFAFAALAILLLIGPAGDQFMRLDRKRFRVFDSHGDQRNDLLDDLQRRAYRKTFGTPDGPLMRRPGRP